MDATPAERPRHTVIEGRYVTLQPLNADAHADTLFNSVQSHDSLWDYMSDGPFADREAFRASIEKKAVSTDPLYFVIIDNQSADAVGYASYLRIEPSHRVIEVGNILYTPRLQRTRGATEAMFLMARHAFEVLRYRRYEWKCNALNGALSARGTSAGLPLRRHLPAAHDHQRTQSGHRLVCHAGRRVDRSESGFRTMVIAG